MSNVIRSASPIAKMFWWTMVLCTGGMWALVRGRPR
jgi:hypothetical protein